MEFLLANHPLDCPIWLSSVSFHNKPRLDERHSLDVGRPPGEGRMERGVDRRLLVPKPRSEMLLPTNLEIPDARSLRSAKVMVVVVARGAPRRFAAGVICHFAHAFCASLRRRGCDVWPKP